MDLINSKTDESRKAAVSQLEGRLSQQIEDIRGALVSSLAEIEVNIDYPEYDLDGITGSSTMEALTKAVRELENFSKSYKRGRL